MRDECELRSANCILHCVIYERRFLTAQPGQPCSIGSTMCLGGSVCANGVCTCPLGGRLVNGRCVSVPESTNGLAFHFLGI